MNTDTLWPILFPIILALGWILRAAFHKTKKPR